MDGNEIWMSCTRAGKHVLCTTARSAGENEQLLTALLSVLFLAARRICRTYALECAECGIQHFWGASI